MGDCDRTETLEHLREMMAAVGATGISDGDAIAHHLHARDIGTKMPIESLDAEEPMDARKMGIPSCAKKQGDDDKPEKDPIQALFDRIGLLCSYGEYSQAKMRARLLREEYPPEEVESALQRAVACGIVDDVRYADVLISGRLRAGRGLKGIEEELERNDIQAKDIAGWPEEYIDRYGDELTRAVHILEKNPPRSKSPHDSAYRRLLGKGYSSDIASKAASRWCANNGT